MTGWLRKPFFVFYRYLLLSPRRSSGYSYLRCLWCNIIVKSRLWSCRIQRLWWLNCIQSIIIVYCNIYLIFYNFISDLSLFAWIWSWFRELILFMFIMLKILFILIISITTVKRFVKHAIIIISCLLLSYFWNIRLVSNLNCLWIASPSISRFNFTDMSGHSCKLKLFISRLR